MQSSDKSLGQNGLIHVGHRVTETLEQISK